MNTDHTVTEHVYRVTAGDVHVFLIVLPDGITLIDGGFPGTMALIEQTLKDLERRPEDIHDVLVTHCHPDHAGGLAEIKRATGANLWMHTADADMAARGMAFREWKPAPGLRNWWFARRVVKRGTSSFEPVSADHVITRGQTIPAAGGIKAIWTPGHSAGHLVFLWPREGGVLFTGDAANNVRGLSGPPIEEDRKQTLESLRKISSEKFRVACFAHGEPIVGNASARFRAKWGHA
jgi:glyoxylase-like metal-dependent hydrolase (beta-lactamase superfamily II)